MQVRTTEYGVPYVFGDDVEEQMTQNLIEEIEKSKPYTPCVNLERWECRVAFIKGIGA